MGTHKNQEAAGSEALITALTERITRLERRNQQLLTIIKEAQATIHQLTKELGGKSADESYNVNWHWISKVMFVIKTSGRPMRGAEILDRLMELDKGLSNHANPATYVSVVLANAVSYKRLLPYKLKGVRGNFYYLPEWADEEGNLDEDMKLQLS